MSHKQGTRELFRWPFVGLLWGSILIGAVAAGQDTKAPKERPSEHPSAKHSGSVNRQGKLGEVVTAGTIIRKTPQPQGRALYTANRGAYLVITGVKGVYYTVLMSDRSRGYVLQKDVRFLEYVVIPLEPRDRTKRK